MPENVNMRDVARAAGVSPGTVSRVLSNRMGRTRVSVATRQKEKINNKTKGDKYV